MSIRFKLGLLLSLLFFAAIGNTVFTFILEEYGEEKLEWVIHTHEVLIESERLIGAVIDAETGQRGYLLTQDSAYLEPYHIGVSSVDRHLQELFRLTSDNLSQQKRLENISGLLTKKLAELDLTINLTQENTPSSISEASSIVKNNSGKNYMDAIRDELTSFNNEELVLLEQRKGAFNESRAYITTLIGAEILFFVFLSIITAMFVKNKFYQPLGMMIEATAKMERGERQEVSDILPKDEMGYLLSRFYQMSETVYAKAKLLDYEANHDYLTGLKNRTGLDTGVDYSIKALSYGQKLAIFFIDLNKFKVLNDSLGHDVGDEILKESALRIKESVRSNDAVYRFGGDEFVVIVNDIKEADHAKIVAEKMLAKFSSPFLCRGHVIDISLSIGISISPEDSLQSCELINRADIAMYAAKRDESVNYKFFDNSMLCRVNDKGDTCSLSTDVIETSHSDNSSQVT
ncbi:diguanylate cyclase [Shewanella schlegeliana]|uniref:diguanylate cyclase domain-containing protein n=1 Tax=Shewanella schlegeliana TaxID=190308 RepID=UPI001BC6E783|nr:diguanylate cyclase [Shewanella schlegeliana]MCL1110700.1 diguanylate cyclase [Shewanella schlegeliana]GIU22597.1 diguanylate cyclase [Shewanella schlegeliana]